MQTRASFRIAADWQGNGFQTTDYVGSGIVHITDGSGGTKFAVYRDFNPPGGPRTNNGGAVTTTTTNGPIFRALAKLSWVVPVTNPLAPQVWGQRLLLHRSPDADPLS